MGDTSVYNKEFLSCKGGFNFDLYSRNRFLEGKGVNHPKPISTGTTIAGIIYSDGVVLGADTRATSGSIVANKDIQKIHFIAENVYCCGAGTAADTENVTKVMRSNLKLQQLSYPKRHISCDAVCTMFKQKLFSYQGHLGAALILGGIDTERDGEGCDVKTPKLFTIFPHGSTTDTPFTTMGSGSLAAMSVLESCYRPGLSQEEAVEIVFNAIKSGIFNDLGSGGNVHIAVMSCTLGTSLLKRPIKENIKPLSLNNYKYHIGSTGVINEKTVYFREDSNNDNDTEQGLHV